MVGRTMGRKRLRLRTYTAVVIVKPPAARATPQSTSKPTQRPQGNWSERLVTAPSPRV